MFDSGIVRFYRKVNVAESGLKPDMHIEYVTQEYYENRTIGFNRMFARRGVNIEISKVIRFWLNGYVVPDMIAIIDGEQYRVDYVTTVQQENGLNCMERTLTKVENWFDEVREI